MQEMNQARVCPPAPVLESRLPTYAKWMCSLLKA